MIKTVKLHFVGIRQKDESQNGCFKKTKHVKFFQRDVRFSENLACFVFLKHPF